MPADVECPATPPELPRDPTPERVKLSPGGAGGTSPSASGRASPDSACPICLGRLDNKAFSDGCAHTFCFTCILEWSKVRAVCPLCKQSFTSIIHNVRSELDYDRYRLPPPPPSPSDHPQAFIYRPGDETRPRWLQLRRQPYRYRSLVLPMLWPVAHRHDYHLPAAAGRPRGPGRSRVTSDARRRLYTTDMWARPTADELTGRYRETGPDFYRNNPACTHRLVPWLNRELNAVLDSPAHLAHVMEHIMELITRLHILSREFRAHLQPYMSPWTEHFVHELYSYARSPYDMVGYDLHVQYGPGRPASPAAHEAVSSAAESDDGGACGALDQVRTLLDTIRALESDSDSDSPVEVVEVLPPRHERPPLVVTLSSDSEGPAPTAPEPRRSSRCSPRALAC
ncbi:E3 ubiquitin-protein ligase Topors-like [Pollicipes pollicipes]|uniref:E3 ubiquitin-protein ligase Topors-like n=1 Tax=Pollicipes pollicipes TaxID=41117 RepID=UPI0018853C05|nr:E3 ubiquitin-protein ligase Topors-like [Pollicipes pollicipes]